MGDKSEKVVDYNALGQVMDTTFTRSSATSGPVFSTHSVKATMVDDDKIKIYYVAVVNMVRDKELRDSCTMHENQADSIIEAAAKKIAKEYKEATGDAIKLKRSSIDSSVEIIDVNHFNQKRSAYFRRIAFFKVE